MFVETKTGEMATGTLRITIPRLVALCQADGSTTIIPRLNVQSIQPQSWSLMPEGLEQGLSSQDMADLLEYLITGGR